MTRLTSIIEGFAFALIVLNALMAADVVDVRWRRDLPAAERMPVDESRLFQPCECCRDWPPRRDLDRRMRPEPPFSSH